MGECVKEGVREEEPEPRVCNYFSAMGHGQ